MGGESIPGLPFPRPCFSSVAAFVSQERERQERETGTGRAKHLDSNSGNHAAACESQCATCPATAKEEELVMEWNDLQHEMRGLVERLLSLGKDEYLEFIAGAVYEGNTALSWLLREFWIQNFIEGSPSVQEREKRQPVKKAVESSGRYPARERLEEFAVQKCESTRSRAIKSELFFKLNVRKTLCTDLNQTHGWGHMLRKHGSNQKGGADKTPEEPSETLVNACKILAKAFSASQARSRYLHLLEKEGDRLRKMDGDARGESKDAEHGAFEHSKTLPTLFEDSSSSLSSFSESEFPFVFTPTPKRRLSSSKNLETGSHISANVSPCTVGGVRRGYDTERMFEDENVDGEQKEVQPRFLDEHGELYCIKQEVSGFVDRHVQVTPRHRSRAFLWEWVQGQRKVACEWNYLCIGASARIQAEWRRFIARRKMKNFKTSSRQLLAYCRAAIVHKAIAHKILAWIDHDQHLHAYSYRKRTAVRQIHKSPHNRKGSFHSPATRWHQETPEAQTLEYASPCNSCIMTSPNYEQEEEDIELLRELDIIRQRVASVTPSGHPCSLPQAIHHSNPPGTADDRKVESQLSSLRKQWTLTRSDQMRRKHSDRANMRGMLFEGAVRDLAKSFDDLELRRERMGQRNVSGSREDMRRAEIICSGVGGIVGIVEGGRESWRIDPLVAARIHDLLNTEGISLSTCKDKFLVGICNIVARRDFSWRRTQFLRWHRRVAQNQEIRIAIREQPTRQIMKSLQAWRAVVEYKMDRRRWRQEVQQDALSLYVRSPSRPQPSFVYTL